MSTLRANTLSNSAGTGSPAITGGELSRARFNLNGTGTIAERGSFNVSSYVDNGTGDYTANFSTAFPNANYAFQISANDNGTTAGQTDGFAYGSWKRGANYVPTSASLIRFLVGYPIDGAGRDQSHINGLAHGDRP